MKAYVMNLDLTASAFRLRLLDLLVENARDYAIFTLDTEGLINSWNPGAERILGFSESEAMGQDGAIIFTPEDRAQGAPEQEKQTALREGRAEDERWHIKKDGNRFFASGVMTPLRNERGEVEGFAKILRERTVRKREEEALRQSEARLSTIFGQAAVGLSEISLEGRFLRVNDELCRLLGRSREDVLGLGIADVTYPTDVPPSLEAVGRTVETGQPASLDKRYLRPDGTLVWANSRVTLLHNREGRPGNLLVVTADLTERRRAEEALRQSEGRIRALVENLPGGAAFILDRDLRYLFAGGEMLHAVGVTPEDFLGKTLREAMPSGEVAEYTQKLSRVLAGETFAYEHEAHDRYFITRGVPLRSESGEVYAALAVSYDITERKRTEEQRIQWEHETTLLTERTRMAQELHDTLAQGFTGIKLQAELADSLLREEPEAARKHLVRVQEMAVQAMAEARNAIRALRLPLLQEGNLPEALERLARQATNGVNVTFEWTGTLFTFPEEVKRDVYRTAQEAVTNALRHSKAQHVWLRLNYSETDLTLTIADDGKGFDTTLSRRGYGVTGMQERAERCGARLEIASTPGQGTTITLRLPRL
jgi:PAS domain S-box-containing protein